MQKRRLAAIMFTDIVGKSFATSPDFTNHLLQREKSKKYLEISKNEALKLHFFEKFLII